MPSPVGHVLAGIAIGLAAQPSEPPRSLFFASWRYPIAAAAIAVLPDADLVLEQFGYPVHRSATHSVALSALLFIVTAAVTGKVTGRISWRWACVAGIAHASHVVMDWLGADPSFPHGLQALWPFSHDFFISGLDVFPSTDKRLRTSPTALMTNVHAVLMETGLMLPVVLAVWMATRTRRSRARTSDRDGPRPPSS